VTAVAWSPDRSQLAYSLFHRRPGDRISSSELYVIPASGGSPTLVVPRDQPGAILDAPSWSRDGQSLFYTYQGTSGGRPVARVERASLSDGSRQALYVDGSFPVVAPDGASLAFIYDDGKGPRLRIGSIDGGDAREIVPMTGFTAMAGPRFSPDGSRIAFTAVGPGPGTGLIPPPSGRIPSLAGLFVSVAEAHGQPWGIWSVRTDGTDLRTATSLQEDEPLVAWSADGAWLAVNGGGGLWVVDGRGAVEPRRLTDGAIGAIDW